jgi:hypothetical protein
MQLLRQRSHSVSRSPAVWACAMVAIICGCATVENTVVADPGVAFSLPLGKTAAVKGTGARITFNRVADDSRCPVDVQCVWAGDARIELTVTGQGGPADPKVVSITPPNNEVTSGDLRIRFVGLAPAPKQSEPSASRAYVAQLVVTRP